MFDQFVNGSSLNETVRTTDAFSRLTPLTQAAPYLSQTVQNTANGTNYNLNGSYIQSSGGLTRYPHQPPVAYIQSIHTRTWYPPNPVPAPILQGSTSSPITTGVAESFRLDQQIGLNNPLEVNASNLNNRVQIQSSFTDNDRFCVQPSFQPQLDQSALNYPTFGSNIQGFNTPRPIVHPVDRNVTNQPLNTVSQSTANSGDFNQFCVVNIIGKHSESASSNINSINNNHADTNKEMSDNEAVNKEVYKVFMVTDKPYTKFKQIEESTGYAQSVERKLLTVENIHLPQVRKDSFPKSKSAATGTPSKAASCKKVKKNQIYGFNPVKGTGHFTQAEVLRKGNPASEAKFHESSSAYFKDYLAFIETQKRERAAREAKESNQTLSLTYQCGCCFKTFNNIDNLNIHMRRIHINKDRNNDCKDGNETVEPVNEKMITSEEVNSSLLESENKGNRSMEMSNISSVEELFLCSICGHESKSRTENNVHVLIHDTQEGTETDKKCHINERQYHQLSKEMDKTRKKNTEPTEELEGMEDIQQDKRLKDAGKDELGHLDGTENGSSECGVKQEISDNPSLKPVSSGSKRKQPNKKTIAKREGILTTDDAERCLEQSLSEQHTHRRKAAIQAKNNLLNPSKGKRKRVRNIENLDNENKMFLEMFGICQSKVCLSRVSVHGAEDINLKTEDSCKVKDEAIEVNKASAKSRRSPRKSKNLSDWSKVINMSNDSKTGDLFNSKLFESDSDSDVEIVELPKAVIVLDVEDGVSTKPSESPKKSDSDLMKTFGIKDISVKLDKLNKVCETPSSSQYRTGITCNKEANVVERAKTSTHNIQTAKKIRLGPKSKRAKNKIQDAENRSVPVQAFDQMSPEEIEKMLSQCGMGISVASPGLTDTTSKHTRTPSPVPSTSKGHGHLKRKKTARKSMKDSALFKKYNLKDSKVILNSLSRIDISLLRNPNSPFGKTDWLKHKFDSDSDSDFDFDIPTPPLTEEFVESPVKLKSFENEPCGNSPKSVSPRRRGRNAEKTQDLKMLEKFGINESKVVIDRSNNNGLAVASETKKKERLSDEELRKKFGIPDTIVVVTSPDKSNSKEIKSPEEAVKSKNLISFDDFKVALASARKNILTKMKGNNPEAEGKNNDTKHGAIGKTVTAKSKRKVNVSNVESSSTPKKQKVEKIVGSDRNTRLRNVDKSGNKKKTSIDKKPAVAQYITKNINKKQRVGQKVCAGNRSSKLAQSNEKNTKRSSHGRLKTLSVTLHRLKINESMKSFKAKAVTRALRNNKSNNLSDTNEQSNLEQNLSSVDQRALRHRTACTPLENIDNRKHVSAKRKSSPGKAKTRVLKTARYGRFCKKHVDNIDSPGKIESEITNKSSVLKERSANLSNSELSKHQLERNSFENYLGEKGELEKISEEIICEMVNKVCSEECSPVMSSHDIKDFPGDIERNVELQKSPELCADNDEIKKNSVEDTPVEKLTQKSCSEIGVENNDDCGKASDGTDSDISLISETSENNDNEASQNESPVINTAEKVSVKGDESEGKNELVSAEMDENIPLGRSRFFDEGENDNDRHSVDGGNDMESDEETENENSKLEQENLNGLTDDKNGIDRNEANVNSACSGDNEYNKLGMECGDLDSICLDTTAEDKNISLPKSSNERITCSSIDQTSLSEDLLMNDASLDKNISCEGESNISKSQIEGNTAKSLSNDDIGVEIKDGMDRICVSSAIIDGKSGSRIGDVYSSGKL